MTGITGSGTAKAAVYASDVSFRAWGAVKGLTYGDGHAMTSSFNGRLQPTEFQVPGIIHNSYEYLPDGRLGFSHDLTVTNSKFDRSFAYDASGRLAAARTGAEARSSSTSTDDRPYKEDIAYDAFSNITSRTGKFWNWPMTIGSAPPQSYANNRNTHWDYDADGRVTNSTNVQYSYDATGNLIETSENRSNILFSYDGDGKRIKTVNAITDTNVPPGTNTTTTYYLPSSVIGSNLTELDETGAKKRGYVYGGAGILAVEKPVTTSDKVMYRLTDAAGYQVRMTLSTGVVEPDQSAELDPFLTNAHLHAPPSSPSHVPGEQTQGSLNSLGFGDAFTSGYTRCNIDGTDVPCKQAFATMASGAAGLDLSNSEMVDFFLNLPGAGGNFHFVYNTDDDVDLGHTSHQNADGSYSATVNVGVSWAGHFEFDNAGGERAHGPGGGGGNPGHTGGTAEGGGEHQQKPKCDATMPTDQNLRAAIYKISTEHTMLSLVGSGREWNTAGTARTGQPITWETLTNEALAIAGTIAFTADAVHASWEATILSVFGSGGGSLTPDVAFQAGRAAVDKALNSDIDSPECHHLKIAIDAAEGTATGTYTHWKNMGYTQWRGRSNGGGFKYAPANAWVMPVGDSYFFFVFPGNSLPGRRRH